MWCLRGSSPLARGTLLNLLAQLIYSGLIPARAGNTSICRGRRRHLWAHPRSRGEHRAFSAGAGGGGGSSPLARGTPQAASRDGWRTGLIPARAGNTAQKPVKGLCTWAHPRSRGEHSPTSLVSPYEMGSSPLARGTPSCRRAQCHYRGLIPARAGNTVRYSFGSGCAGAHPRSRGEHYRPPYVCSIGVGSSPLARGTLSVIGAR